MLNGEEGFAVIELAQDRLEEAAEVLVLAFERDALMRWYLAENEASYLARLRAMMQRTCIAQLARHWPLLGIIKDDQVVGVASVTPPDASDSPFPASLRATTLEFFSLLGEQAINRLASYDHLRETHSPTEPHFSVPVLGIHPQAQGRGYGKMLLDAIQQRSQVHPASRGVALDTNPTNAPFYQRCGYKLRNLATLDILEVWFLFRAKS